MIIVGLGGLYIGADVHTFATRIRGAHPHLLRRGLSTCSRHSLNGTVFYYIMQLSDAGARELMPIALVPIVI